MYITYIHYNPIIPSLDYFILLPHDTGPIISRLWVALCLRTPKPRESAGSGAQFESLLADLQL